MKMKLTTMLAVAFFAAGITGNALAQDEKKEETTTTPAQKTVGMSKWCTVTTPEKADFGEDITITVDAKIDDPTKMTCSLHWKKDGKWQGVWRATASTVKVDDKSGKQTFHIKLRQTKDMEDGGVEAVVLVYLSPNGNWKDKTVSAMGAPFPVY